jgi:hypothetical protein
LDAAEGDQPMVTQLRDNSVVLAWVVYVRVAGQERVHRLSFRV